MAQTIPATMKALVTQADNTAQVQDVAVPAIDADEVLVKVVAIAQNPIDWKCTYLRSLHVAGPHSHSLVDVAYAANPGTICGSDWSGYVVKAGKNVTSPAIGDHVAGFVHGGNYEGHGGFAEYVKTQGDLLWKVPEGTLTHEDAATMGCA